jgi:hypothetical protein
MLHEAAEKPAGKTKYDLRQAIHGWGILSVDDLGVKL